MNEQIDLTARLLATENLTIVRVTASTASFDVKNRILSIPAWKNMTPDIENMLIAHEVGHALFTSCEAWSEVFTRYPDMKTKLAVKGYVNIVEDARIEKLMKRRYPGLRRAFSVGYKGVIELDFFKLKGVDVNTMLLIDRINLYFKTNQPIDFTDEELVYVERTSAVETIDEAIALAVELYEFSKKQAKTEKQETPNQDVQKMLSNEYDGDYEDSESDESEPNDSEPEDSKEDSDEIVEPTEGELNEDETKEVKSAPAKPLDANDEASAEAEAEVPEPDVESRTDTALNDELEKLTDGSVLYRYYELATNTAVDPVVPFKTIVAEVKVIQSNVSSEILNANRESFEQFKTRSNKIVSYLVKEFEMKKSASNYARSLTSKTGSLNSKKLHAYRLTDDIFKKITVVPNGKNHGFVFLLDWSGSMMNVIKPTIEQVINLVMFCRKAGIPFEVFAFSTQYNKYDADVVNARKAFEHSMSSTRDKNVMYSNSNYSLLNLFSSKMTISEFNSVAYYFTSSPNRFKGRFSLGATPLTDALIYMIKYIPMYKKANNIEKLTFITLTDGDSSGASFNVMPTTTKGLYVDGDYRIQKYRNMVNDSMTGKSYEVTEYPNNQTKLLLSIIKDRYAVCSIGFYITPTRKADIVKMVNTNTNSKFSYKMVEDLREQCKRDGVGSLANTGRDDFFVIPDNRTAIVDHEFDINGEASAAAIARVITKNMNVTKHSRILLDKFIHYVA